VQLFLFLSDYEKIALNFLSMLTIGLAMLLAVMFVYASYRITNATGGCYRMFVYATVMFLSLLTIC
jgi:hypothetical protein